MAVAKLAGDARRHQSIQRGKEQVKTEKSRLKVDINYREQVVADEQVIANAIGVRERNQKPASRGAERDYQAETNVFY